MTSETLPLTRPCLAEEERRAVAACLESGWVTQGPLTRRFEELVAARHAVEHALATTSCTAALHLCTLSLGIGPGDEVLVPAFTWVTSAHCVEYVGARAVFVDVDPVTLNVDPVALADAVTPRTRAVIAVHLFGLAAPMAEILAVGRRHGIRVIEDAACAIACTSAGRPVGGLGDVGCFSFHPRKIITTGEGGMVTTNDSEIAERVQSLRNHGATGVPPATEEPHGPWTMARFDVLGYNLRLSDIQAAVGVAQMARLDALVAERRAVAERYGRMLEDASDVQLPGSDGGGHTYQSYVVRVREGGRARRNRVMAHLAEHGIETRPGTHAVHRLGYYQKRYGHRSEEFPHAAAAEDETMTLPIFPGITISQQERVVGEVRRALTLAVRGEIDEKGCGT